MKKNCLLYKTNLNKYLRNVRKIVWKTVQLYFFKLLSALLVVKNNTKIIQKKNSFKLPGTQHVV